MTCASGRRRLQKTDGDQIVQYGYGSGADWAYDVLPGLAGQMAFNEDVTASLLDNEATIAIFDHYQKMMHEDGSTVTPGSLQTNPNELFLAGQLGILLDGTWQAGYFRYKSDEINFTWDVGLPPRMAGSENYFIPNFTGGWVIPKTAPDRDASWEVMKAYASPNSPRTSCLFHSRPRRCGTVRSNRPALTSGRIASRRA